MFHSAILLITDKPFRRKMDEGFSNRLVNLSGHRVVGGMRASIYNAMPDEGVNALISFMKDFEATNKK